MAQTGEHASPVVFLFVSDQTTTLLLCKLTSAQVTCIEKVLNRVCHENPYLLVQRFNLFCFVPRYRLRSTILILLSPKHIIRIRFGFPQKRGVTGGGCAQQTKGYQDPTARVAKRVATAAHTPAAAKKVTAPVLAAKAAMEVVQAKVWLASGSKVFRVLAWLEK